MKQATDDAIALFADKDSADIILTQPYRWYVDKFNEELKQLLSFTPTPQSVDVLPDEKAQVQFIRNFRGLIRTLNDLIGFTDFKWSDLDLRQQLFEDFKSKYLDIYDEVQRNIQGDGYASIITDINFEIELMRRDEINLRYIVNLL